MKKHKVYTGRELVEQYDYRHFGGNGGQHVFQKDCAVLESLIGTSRSLLLDVPCGTGAYAQAFKTKNHDMIAADASISMLEITGHREGNIPRVLCDANQLPFKNHVFDAAMTIRLFQHLPEDDMARILRELERATKSSGLVIFDTFRWTPRRMRFLRHFFKGEMYVYSHQVVEKVIEKAGLRKARAISLYLFSPIMYRRMPAWFLRGLDAVEKIVPQRWLLRTFWACTRR
jgi:ubiquinone/menaquinone biosynthesis C-methylase UbiE